MQLGLSRARPRLVLGVLTFTVEADESNGADLSGTKLALDALLPGNFLGGMHKAALYLDEAASEEQRNDLGAIFQGKRGRWGAGTLAQFLPSKTMTVGVTGGRAPACR